MDAFPAFVPLSAARVVIVGEGEAADAKARLFEGSPATVVRASEAEGLEPSTYAGARLAFIATWNADVAGQAGRAARAAGALVNVVDRPELCDFVTPAIVDRGVVVAAVGTGGAAPVLATVLRSEIEARWPEGLGRVASLCRTLRDEVKAGQPDSSARRVFWRRLLSGDAARAALAGDMEQALVLARASLARATPAPGRVLFVRAPAQPDALTLGALRALGGADRLVIAADVSREIVALARRDAVRVPTATADQLAAWAAEGLSVVRLAAIVDPQETEQVRELGAAVETLA